MLREKYFTQKEKNGMLGGDQETGFMKGPPWERYMQSKLANSVFCLALHEKLAASTQPQHKNILSLCAHPGSAKTNIMDHIKDEWSATKTFFMDIIEDLVLQTSEDGAMGLLKAMMDTKENVEGGALYGPRMMTGYPIAMPPKDHESDAESKTMLWKTSEAAIGASFEL